MKRKGWMFFLLLFMLTQGDLLANKKYWVFFKDKGISASQLESIRKVAVSQLSSRAVWRRALRGRLSSAFDERDLPVNENYVAEVRRLCSAVIHRSRWLNAVSVLASKDQIEQLRLLPVVKKIVPVGVFIRRDTRFEKSLHKEKTIPGSTYGGDYDYGASFTQLQLINVPSLHRLGFSGKGVLIALLDSGFKYDSHKAFQQTKIIAERDFVFHDSITSDEFPEDTPGQHNHGTMVLSIIGGYYPGWLIGPAFNATYALAKTEYVPTETRIEEDNWVAGIEWADSLGADIVSTSLGYRDFDDGFAYTYQDLNGETMITSIAAKTAVEKGIVVVASAGNEGNNPDWPYVISPAEGKGVIAVGAVNADGVRAGFSSIGPTADGRIKPDVMAMGQHVTVANPNKNEAIYTSASGTSFSAPLVAGVCALLLEINPTLSPQDVWQALTSTASQASFPDNNYGYGIIDAVKAAEYAATRGEVPEKLKIDRVFLQRSSSTVQFTFWVPETEEVTISIFNALGQKVAEIQRYFFIGKNTFMWEYPANLASAVYFVKFSSTNQIATHKFVVVR